MTDSSLVEKLNQIRHKLEKYLKVKDNTKIKAYLNQLSTIENVNKEILKEAKIVECLKRLNKEQNPEYSEKALNIIHNWKKIITITNEQNQKDEQKELSKSVLSTSLTKQSELNRKRSSSDLNDSQSKKPKISLNDYKSKKEIKEEEHETNESGSENTIKPKTNIFEQNSSNKNVNRSSQEVSDYKKQPIVPLPTVPLQDILSDSIIATPNPNTTKNYQSFASSILSSNKSDQNKSFNNLGDDEALAKIFSSKQSKRTLYTGRKNDGGPIKIPKLFDLATRSLIQSIDELPLRVSIYNSRNRFPIPFDLIKPVLERANAKQLQSIEYYSPHLLEDSDYLWKKLCEQEFKQIPNLDEDDTWREVYFKKLDEREEKFRRARDLISKKQAEKPKERQTQIATAKFVSGGARSSSVVLNSSSAASKLKILSSSSGPVRQIVHDSSSRKVGSSSALGPKRPIPSAPAMSQGMKATMKLIKKTTRR